MPTKTKTTTRKTKTPAHHTPKKKQHSRTLAIALPIAIIGIIALIAAYQFYTYIKPNFRTPDKQPAYIYITPQCTIDSIITQLDQLHVTANKNSFTRWAQIKHLPENIKTGRYRISNGMNNKQLITNLIAHMQAPVKLKINNIRTLPQLASRVSKQLMLDSTTLINTLTDPETLNQYNLKKEQIIALFIPNTYEIYWDIQPQTLIKRMHHEYQQFWTPARLQKAQQANLSPIEIITLASIVEEETNRKQDKPIIAGLYINRLRIGMPLQACPTAKYASGDFTLRRILYEHTQIDSPYNTYRNKGLPPGPIRTPSIETIDAVLNYDHNNYLYMCAKETRNGEHYYSSTYAEHARNARRYQQAVYNKK